MALTAWFKKRQFDQGISWVRAIGILWGLVIGIEQGRAEGIEIGIKQGRAKARKRYNAKLRALAKEYGIPEDKLTIKDEDDD